MDYEKKIMSAAKKVLPAVVSIVISKELEQIESELPPEFFKLPPQERMFLKSRLHQAPRDEHGRIKMGGGSGFIIDRSGIVLTNKHVIADPNASYNIIGYSDKKFKTKLLARDPINDVAILKIDPEDQDLPVIKMSSKKAEIGQTVIAAGNALGEFQNTISSGIVSGLSRFITATTDPKGHQERLRGLIQTDAAINPGNSGGPLVNLDGEAIGINSAVVFGAQNIGFAIPINRAQKDLAEIKKYGHIRKPFLGVRYVILNSLLKERFNLPLDYGALVVNEGMPGDYAVMPGSAAEKAGIREFDVILSCEGEKITGEKNLEDIVAEHEIGDAIKFEILRNNKKMNTEITLEELVPKEI